MTLPGTAVILAALILQHQCGLPFGKLRTRGPREAAPQRRNINSGQDARGPREDAQQ